MTDILIAIRSVRVESGGTIHRLRRGRTYAHRDSEIVRARPELWEPLVVDFPADDPPSAGPTAKEVRAWARGQGIEVPARGKIPDEVVARYQAEHDTDGEDGGGG